MLRNEEIQALISAVGTGIGEEFLLDKLRQTKTNGEFYQSMNT